MSEAVGERAERLAAARLRVEELETHELPKMRSGSPSQTARRSGRGTSCPTAAGLVGYRAYMARIGAVVPRLGPARRLTAS